MPVLLRSVWLSDDVEESGRSLFVWGENSPGPQLDEADRSDRSANRRDPELSVEAPAMLRYEFRRQLPGVQPADMQLRKLDLHLPRREALTPGEARPVPVFGVQIQRRPSMQLLRCWGQGRNSVDDGAIRKEEHSRYAPGPDTLFWVVALDLASELLDKGCVLPELAGDLEGTRLAWRVWRGAPEVEAESARLVALMPRVNLAYALHRGTGLTAGALLKDFLEAAVHELMCERVDALPGPSFAANGRNPEDLPELGRVWSNLLSGMTVNLADRPPEIAVEFKRLWRAWIARSTHFDPVRARVAFELRSPDPDEAGQEQATWPLRIGMLRGPERTDFLSADEIWRRIETADPAAEPERKNEDGLQLLAGLRVAGRVWPRLRHMADRDEPSSLRLSLQEAYAFLSEDGPTLQAAGFEVILPDWWDSNAEQELRLVLRLDDAPAALSAERQLPEPGDREAFTAELQLELANRRLSEGQLSRIAGTPSPLVYMNDRWLQLNRSQIEAARLSLAAASSAHRVSLFQALHLIQEHADGSNHADPQTWSEILGDRCMDLNQMQITLETPASRLQEFRQRLQTVTLAESHGEPDGFVGMLRPYQRRGLAWLWYLHEIGLGACLADDMGLGKTVQAIALFLAQEESRPAERRLARLIVCPTSVMRNWQRELARFSPQLRTHVHHGPRRADKQQFLSDLEGYDVILTSFGTARVDQGILRSVAWHTLVVDEAQNIKNSATQQAQAIRSLQGRHRVALTGTPIENRLAELWSVIDFVNVGYLGTQADFFRRYIAPIEGQDDRGRLARLKRVVQPFVLRRLKTDPDVVADLPEKQEMSVTCDLTAEQTLLYAAAVTAARSGLENLEGMRRRGTVLALITQLKKIANHPELAAPSQRRLERRSGKLDRLMEMLDESLASGNKALVFTNFVRMGEMLQQHLSETLDVQADFLHGGVDLRRRQMMVDRFQTEGARAPVLLLSLRTGGVGINLTAANQVYHFDRWWNPAVEQQATDRAHRIGQTQRVQVYKMIAAGTIEEHVDRLIRSKTRLAQDVLGSGEAWLTELSNQQLFDLLALPQSQRELAK